MNTRPAWLLSGVSCSGLCYSQTSIYSCTLRLAHSRHQKTAQDPERERGGGFGPSLTLIMSKSGMQPRPLYHALLLSLSEVCKTLPKMNTCNAAIKSGQNKAHHWAAAFQWDRPLFVCTDAAQNCRRCHLPAGKHRKFGIFGNQNKWEARNRLFFFPSPVQ